MNRFRAGVAVRPLGDRHQRHLRQSQRVEDLADGVELAAAAVDDDEVRAIAETNRRRP